jgi:3-oxoacyl-[acyl-carrier protein] reductase
VGGDLTRKEQVEKLINETIASFGGIDILVNNAGTLVERKKVAEMNEALWDRVMDVNMKSTFLCTKAVLPHMRGKTECRIINISSIAGRNGGGLGAGHYSAAKAAMMAFTKNLAKELASDNILVNAVAPGVITTPYHDEYSSDEMRQKFAANTPLQREGRPEEVAYGILFMASTQASFITGETLEINGGMLMD